MGKEVKKMKKKIVGLLIAIMFLLIAIPQVGADEGKKVEMDNKNVFGLCYFENIEPGEFTPANKCPYFGCTTIFTGHEGTETTIYNKKGGEELTHFEGNQIVFVFIMLGYHEYTETSRIYAGTSFGVIILGR